MEETIHEQKTLLRDFIVNCVRRWGNETTDATLDPSCQIYCDPNIEGFIGYRLEKNCAVVYGDPVCAPNEKTSLALSFQDYCKKSELSTIYAIVSEEFAEWAGKTICPISFEFGERLILNPQHNPSKNAGRHGSLIRRKVKHAQNEGVIVKEYVNKDEKIERAIENVGIDWLNSRRGPQIHISHVHLFEDKKGKRWFYAQKDNGTIEGVVVLNELQSKNGWLLNHLMITHDAPNGTPELLVISALETLEKENCNYVTFGAVPAKKIKSIKGVNKMTEFFVHLLYSIARKIFSLDGFQTFWGKFNPSGEKVYLLFSDSSITVNGLISLMKAMNVNLKI